MDEFEWDFNPSIKRAQIYELATANFIRQNRDILLLGGFGGEVFHPKIVDAQEVRLEEAIQGAFGLGGRL